MPVLGSSCSPPQSKSTPYPELSGNGDMASNPVQSSPTLSKQDQNSTSEASSNLTCKIPSITLDADVITDIMAARLAMSLLGHILFLKSQVPFPVVQLARMPGGHSNTRASRKRADLLTSFDTLACHLQTTFTALSTAIARSSYNIKFKSNIEPPCYPRRFDGPTAEILSDTEPRRLARAYLAIVLGSSASSAKTRVMFAVDGFEVKVWGKGDDVIGSSMVSGVVDGVEKVENIEAEDDEEDEGGEENESSEEGTESDSSGDEDGSESGLESDSFACSTSDLEFGLESSTDSIIDATPPPSRSPSPTSSLSLSRSSSPSHLPEPEPSTPQHSHSTSTPPQSRPTELEPEPIPEHQTPTYASEQAALRTAERLLSRTLANACAEEEGRSMAAELAPTQTHVLLRAPRRFEHPAWTPRQNWGGIMDAALGDFLEDSGFGLGSEGGLRDGKKRHRKGKRMEGVWVRCRGSEVSVDDKGEKVYEGQENGESREGEGDEDEDDEMIWWSWDGKLVGFSDW